MQYACWDYTELLLNHGVRISMAAVGKPEENGYAERLMRTIKEEEVDLSDYRDFHDACQHLGRFLDDVYTHKRIHSAWAISPLPSLKRSDLNNGRYRQPRNNQPTFRVQCCGVTTLRNVGAKTDSSI